MKALFKDGWIKEKPIGGSQFPKEYTAIYKVKTFGKESDTYIEDSTAKYSLMNNGLINLTEIPMSKITNLCIWNRILTEEERELVVDGEKYYYN